MSVELEDLTTPLTIAQVETAFYDGMAARGVDTTSWKPGAVVRTLVLIFAIITAALSRLIALLAKSSFLDDSSGDWLTIVARKTYGVERITGTFASGYVTLTNAGAGVYSGDAGDLVCSNSSTGRPTPARKRGLSAPSAPRRWPCKRTSSGAIAPARPPTSTAW